MKQPLSLHQLSVLRKAAEVTHNGYGPYGLGYAPIYPGFAATAKSLARLGLVELTNEDNAGGFRGVRINGAGRAALATADEALKMGRAI